MAGDTSTECFHRWPVFGGKLELAHVAAGREVGVESWAPHFEPACGVRAGNVDELIFEARLNQNLDFRARFPMQRLPYPQIVTNASQTQKESILRVSVLPEKYATGAGKFRTRCRFVLLASLAVYETMQFRPKRLPLCWLVKCAAALQHNSSDQRNSMVAWRKRPPRGGAVQFRSSRALT